MQLISLLTRSDNDRLAIDDSSPERAMCGDVREATAVAMKHPAMSKGKLLLMSTFLSFQAADRIRQNLDSLHDSNKLSNDTKMARIATEVIRNMNTVPAHPLGF